jgi:hypothetical protein
VRSPAGAHLPIRWGSGGGAKLGRGVDDQPTRSQINLQPHDRSSCTAEPRNAESSFTALFVSLLRQNDQQSRDTRCFGFHGGDPKHYCRFSCDAV